MSGRVLVTGASRGIGRVTASTLARAGWQVTACARSQDDLQRAVGELAGDGHAALALDITDEAAWVAAAPLLEDVTAVVCAAGVLGPIGDLADIDMAEFSRTLDVNVTGTLLTLRAVQPRLLAAGGAAVLFSGGGATGPFARFDAYAASKVAVVRLAENLAARGLRVNAIAPGFIVTAMQSGVLDAGPERAGQAYFERVRDAVNEDAGDDPRRAADLVAFLLSDEARAISGKLISAPWDPWEDDGFRARLAAEKDLATLRRVDDQFFTTMPSDA